VAVVDAGPLIALADRKDGRHGLARRFFQSTEEPLFLSPFVLAEADYIVLDRLGVEVELKLLTT
jgi:predicted nucleic acid-binding protein